MPPGEFTIPIYLDYLATFTWALTGAIVGARLRFDIVGVFVVALVSSMGGGLIRDGLFLQRVPMVLTNGAYLLLIAAAVLLTGALSRWFARMEESHTVNRVVDLIDSIGTPAFAIVGMQLALAQRVSLPGAVLIGVINGVGGGLLRDILCGQRPLLLQPGQFSSLIVLAACIAYVASTYWGGYDSTRTGLATMALFFVVRALTIRFNWRTRPVLEDDAQ